MVFVDRPFVSFQSEQAKEKEDNELNKPTKKRWFARIQRANNCHARIHLRAEFNATSGDYDGETQMIYYPQHFHNGEEDTPEILEKVREKYPHDKWFGGGVGPTAGGLSRSAQTGNGSCFTEGDSGSSFSLDSTSDILQMHADEANSEGHPKAQQPPLQECSLIAAAAPRPTLMFEGDEQPAHKSEAAPAFLTDEAHEFSKEYVLPADDAEWTKLFEVLATRLASGELAEAERKEAETLLSYRNLISVVSLSEQVSIFQRMCALTNSSLGFV